MNVSCIYLRGYTHTKNTTDVRPLGQSKQVCDISKYVESYKVKVRKRDCNFKSERIAVSITSFMAILPPLPCSVESSFSRTISDVLSKSLL